MKYKSIHDDETKYTVTEVKKDTTIDTEYGPVLITKGNYIVEIASGDNKGKKFGITKTDLDLQYKKEK